MSVPSNDRAPTAAEIWRDVWALVLALVNLAAGFAYVALMALALAVAGTELLGGHLPFSLDTELIHAFIVFATSWLMFRSWQQAQRPIVDPAPEGGRVRAIIEATVADQLPKAIARERQAGRLPS
ncbi:MAG: hypothetical protein NW206_20080 [Hyphomonadaceae bacterium]|nr:hypothetical protein [Hyphomonadaceae bacterium]